MPSGLATMTSMQIEYHHFTNDFLMAEFSKLKQSMKEKYPRIFLILGNDDGRSEEREIIDASEADLWEYMHNRKIEVGSYSIYGYSYIPPSPFVLKDWERYDVSRFLDPGCTPPEEGMHSIEFSEHDEKYATIQNDLHALTNDDNLENAIFLFHSPPHNCKLDRAALDGKMIDYVPLDIHIGSIAIRNLIEERQPLLSLHGHVHESARITGSWREQFGRTTAFSAAHDGPELALVSFNLENLGGATRRLL